MKRRLTIDLSAHNKATYRKRKAGRKCTKCGDKLPRKHKTKSCRKCLERQYALKKKRKTPVIPKPEGVKEGSLEWLKWVAANLAEVLPDKQFFIFPNK